MILADVNVLIYAFRKDVPQHAVCRAWLEGVVSGDAHFGMTRLALGAVVRITTDPRIFKEPSAAEEAFRFCDNLLGQPHCDAVKPRERHWDPSVACAATPARPARALPTRGSPRSRSSGLRVDHPGPRLRAVSGPEVGRAAHLRACSPPRRS